MTQKSNKETKFKSGYAAIIGKPNVGKSTLMNRLVAAKVAAISPKPQTTRNKITGIVHLPGGQIILLDTPGIHKAGSKLNRLMVKASLAVYDDVDLILFMIEAKNGFTEEDRFALDSLRRVTCPVLLVINKIDLVPKPRLLELMDQMNTTGDFVEIVPVSALKKDGLKELSGAILGQLSEGPQYFPEHMVTDSPEKFLMQEIIREKIMNLCQFEIPYSVAVVIESISEGKKGVTVLEATVYTEKKSHKKILIGDKGDMMKRIGSLARKEIEKRFGLQVYLNLFVKVKTGWRENLHYLKEFGYINDPH